MADRKSFSHGICCSRAEHWMKTAFHNLSSLPIDASENRTDVTSAFSLFLTPHRIRLCNPTVSVIHVRQSAWTSPLSACVCLCFLFVWCLLGLSSSRCCRCCRRCAEANGERRLRPRGHRVTRPPCEVVAVTSTPRCTLAGWGTTVQPDYRVAP